MAGHLPVGDAGLEARAKAQKATRARAYSREGRGMAHWLYGVYLLKSWDADRALREFRAAERELSGAPSPLTQSAMGLAYFLKRDYEHALAHLQESTRLEPRHSPGHFWTGRVYEEQGNFPKAIDEFEKVDLVRENNPIEVQKFYDALRKAVGLDPTNGYWHWRLEVEWKQPRTNAYEVARLYLHLGDKDRAYDWLGRFAVGDSYGLLIDPCWDQHDERYRAFARRFGLIP